MYKCMYAYELLFNTLAFGMISKEDGLVPENDLRNIAKTESTLLGRHMTRLLVLVSSGINFSAIPRP